MSIQLNRQQKLAIKLLADCKPLPDVAQVCGISERTLRRWKEIPKFQVAVTKAARRRMEAAGRAFDRRNELAIDATWKAQRELLAYIRGEKDIPFRRLIELRRILAEGERTLDRLRISTRAKNRGELLLFMRKERISAGVSASHCNEEPNKIEQDAQTPQKPPISGHAYGARAAGPQATDGSTIAANRSACLRRRDSQSSIGIRQFLSRWTITAYATRVRRWRASGPRSMLPPSLTRPAAHVRGRLAGETPAPHKMLVCMRQNDNSANMSANLCDNVVNKKDESTETPQKSLISEHCTRWRFSTSHLTVEPPARSITCASLAGRMSALRLGLLVYMGYNGETGGTVQGATLMAIRLNDEETEKFVLSRKLLTPEALAPFRVQVSVDSVGTLYDLLVAERIITAEMVAELQKNAPAPPQQSQALRSISGRPTSFLNRASAPGAQVSGSVPAVPDPAAPANRRSTRIQFDDGPAPASGRLPAAGAARTSEPLPPTPHVSADRSRDSGASLCKGWPDGMAPADSAAGHVQALLRLARQQGAGEIYLSAERVPSLRIHGELRPAAGQGPLSAATAAQYVQQLLTREQYERFERSGDLEVCYEFDGGGRFRANLFKHRAGVELALCAVPQRIATAAELGLPEACLRLAQFSSGLVLAASTRGNGKTATLMALLDIINRSRHGRIVTIEEPLEYAVAPQKCGIVQIDLGRHALSVTAAVDCALHDDADIVVIGELKTVDCVSAAVRACEAGLLVLATVQAADCGRAIDRVACTHDDSAHLRNGLAENLRGIVAQQLIPKKDGSGRALACEVLINSTSVANIIREGKTQNLVNVMQTGKQQGMLMIDDALKGLLDAGTIAVEEALLRGKDKNSFKQFLTPAEPAAAPAAPGSKPDAVKQPLKPDSSKPPTAAPRK